MEKQDLQAVENLSQNSSVQLARSRSNKQKESEILKKKAGSKPGSSNQD